MIHFFFVESFSFFWAKFKFVWDETVILFFFGGPLSQLPIEGMFQQIEPPYKLFSHWILMKQTFAGIWPRVMWTDFILNWRWQPGFRIYRNSKWNHPGSCELVSSWIPMKVTAAGADFVDECPVGVVCRYKTFAFGNCFHVFLCIMFSSRFQFLCYQKHHKELKWPCRWDEFGHEVID